MDLAEPYEAFSFLPVRHKHTQSSFPTTCSVFPASFMLKHMASFVASAQLLATFTQRAQYHCRYAHGAIILHFRTERRLVVECMLAMCVFLG